jgi:hypothetical protein
MTFSEKPERPQPPAGKRNPVEAPFFQDEFDPHILDEIETSPDDSSPESLQQDIENLEEDWYWKEPDNIWLQEDMWPWPKTHPNRKPKNNRY